MFLVVPLLSLSVVVGTGFGIWAFGQQSQPSGEASGNVVVTESAGVKSYYVAFGETIMEAFPSINPNNNEKEIKTANFTPSQSGILLTSPMNIRTYLTSGARPNYRMTVEFTRSKEFDKWFTLSASSSDSPEGQIDVVNLKQTYVINKTTDNGIDPNFNLKYIDWNPFHIAANFKTGMEPITEKKMSEYIDFINATNETDNRILTLTISFDNQV